MKKKMIRMLSGILCISLLFSQVVIAKGIDKMDYPSYPYPTTDYNENYRNQFHFSTQAGDEFDVNGLVYLDGEYHLFYQHWIDDPVDFQGRSYIGHAVSRDMMHWTQLPVATQAGVFPGEQNFSGTTVIDKNNDSGFKTGDEDSPDVMVTFYSAVGYGIALAYSNDRGRTWVNYEGNPMIDISKDDKYYPRDPKVFYYEPTDTWVMALYENGTTFYNSKNLRDWTKVSNLDFGHECPDMFEIEIEGSGGERKWVLQDASGSYLIGGFDGQTFTPDNRDTQKMDKGPSYYAAQTFTTMPDGDNRIVQLAWMHNWEQPELPTQGWKHGTTFPVEIKLVKDSEGKLTLTRLPISEIEDIYSDEQIFEARTYNKRETPLKDISSNALDVAFEIDVNATTANEFGIRFSDYTLLYNKSTSKLGDLPVTLKNGILSLRFLRDAGSLETYVSDGLISYTKEIQFDLNDNTVALVTDGDISVKKLIVRAVERTWDKTSHTYPAAQETSKSNLGGNWTAEWSGKWTNTINGYQGLSGHQNDSYYIYRGAEVDSQQDFSYEADIRVSQGLGGLLFRAENNLSSFYCINIQRVHNANGTFDGMADLLRLWRKNPDGGWHDLGVYKLPEINPESGNDRDVIEGKSYHIRVVGTGYNIKVYLGNTEIFNVTDSAENAATGNLIALNVWGNNPIYPLVGGGVANFDNIKYSQSGVNDSNGGTWNTISGNWTQNHAGVATNGSAEAVNAQEQENFVFETTLNQSDNNVSGVVLRANSEGLGYKILADREKNEMRFYVRNTLKETFKMYFDFSLATQMKIVAAGKRIQVYVNRQKCFDVTDETYSKGKTHLINESSSAVFTGIKFRAPGYDATISELFSYSEKVTISGKIATVDVPAYTHEMHMPQITAHATDQNAFVSVLQAGEGFDSSATVKITNEAGDKTETYTVKFRAVVPNNSISVINEITGLKVGSSYQFITDLPKEYLSSIEWGVSGDAFAISSDGVLTALKAGVTSVTAKIGGVEKGFAVTSFETSAPKSGDVLVENSAGDMFYSPISYLLNMSTSHFSQNDSGLSFTETYETKNLMKIKTGTTYRYEANVSLDENNVSAGIIVRANEDKSSYVRFLIDHSTQKIVVENQSGVLYSDTFTSVLHTKYMLAAIVTGDKISFEIDGAEKHLQSINYSDTLNYAGIYAKGEISVSNMRFIAMDSLVKKAQVLSVGLTDFTSKKLTLNLPETIDFVPPMTIESNGERTYSLISPRKFPGSYMLRVNDVTNLVTDFNIETPTPNGSLAAESITINGENIRIEPSQSVQLTYSITPSASAYNKVTWSSSNPAIADVDTSGKVTGFSYGDVTITAKVDKVQHEITVKVIDYFVTNLDNPNTSGAEWKETPDGLFAEAELDSTYIVPAKYSDVFDLSVDVMLKTINDENRTASLLFGVDGTGEKGYSLTLIGAADGTYHLKLMKIPHISLSDDLFTTTLEGYNPDKMLSLRMRYNHGKVSLYCGADLLATFDDIEIFDNYAGLAMHNTAALFQNFSLVSPKITVVGETKTTVNKSIELDTTVDNIGENTSVTWIIKGDNAEHASIENGVFSASVVGVYSVIAVRDGVESDEHKIEVEVANSSSESESTSEPSSTKDSGSEGSITQSSGDTSSTESVTSTKNNSGAESGENNLVLLCFTLVLMLSAGTVLILRKRKNHSI